MVSQRKVGEKFRRDLPPHAQARYISYIFPWREYSDGSGRGVACRERVPCEAGQGWGSVRLRTSCCLCRVSRFLFPDSSFAFLLALLLHWIFEGNRESNQQKRRFVGVITQVCVTHGGVTSLYNCWHQSGIAYACDKLESACYSFRRSSPTVYCCVLRRFR